MYYHRRTTAAWGVTLIIRLLLRDTVPRSASRWIPMIKNTFSLDLKTFYAYLPTDLLRVPVENPFFGKYLYYLRTFAFYCISVFPPVGWVFHPNGSPNGKQTLPTPGARKQQNKYLFIFSLYLYLLRYVE